MTTIDQISRNLSKMNIKNNKICKNRTTKTIKLTKKECVFILKRDDSIFTTDNLIDIDEYFKDFILDF
jgi:hypothetical protein